MKALLILITTALLTLASGCSSGSTPAISEPAPDGDQVVLVWTETGGCAQAGPNCATYQVTTDGTVTTLRSSVAGLEEAASGTIPAATVIEWIEIVSGTDLGELEARLGPGEMTAAFDGVDFVLEAPGVGYTISSVEFEFAANEPFFQAARAVVQAAAEAAPLEIQFR